MSLFPSVVFAVFGGYDGCAVCCVCLLCVWCLTFRLCCLPGWWDNDYTFCCVGFCVLGVSLFVWGCGCCFALCSAVLYRQWLRSALCPLFTVLCLLFCIDDGYSLRYVRCLRCYPLTYPCWCSIVLYRQWLRCALCSVLCFRCRLLCLGCPTCLVGMMAMVRAMSYVFCLWCCSFVTSVLLSCIGNDCAFCYV